MDLGVLLWVSCIGFVLFDCSAGIPSIKGYKHPTKTKARNIGDDWDDDKFLSEDFDYGNLLTRHVLTSYSNIQQQTPVEQKQILPRKKLPNTASAPEVERLVNGNFRDWSLDNPESTLLLPLSSSYQPSAPAKPQPGPDKTQSASPGQSLSFDSWKTVGSSHAPAGSSSPNRNLKSGSSGAGFTRLVYEDVFEYPPKERANVGAQPVSIPGMGLLTSSRLTERMLSFGKRGYQPHGDHSVLKRKLASFKKDTRRLILPSPPLRYFWKSRYDLQ